MAYDTYDGLKATVADWLHRADLTSRIPDFIRLAEATINRRLTIFPKEVEVPLVSAIGSRFIALPSDYSSPIQLQTTYTEPREPLTLLEASQLPIDDANQGMPFYWAIDGANIAFERPSDQAYPLRLRYVQTVFLSDSNQTVPTLVRAPDLYLYGALVHSVEFTQNDARRPGWVTKFNQILQDVAAEASRSKGMAPLVTEIPGALLGSSYGVRGWWQ